MFEMFAFDICAILILVVLLFALSVRKTITDEAGRRLVMLVLITIAAAVFDIAAVYNNGRASTRVSVNYWCEGLYHVARNAAFFLYAGYIVTITGTWHKAGRILVGILKYVPFAAIVAIAITAPSTKKFYFFNENNLYIRGEAFPVIYLCSAIYAGYALLSIAENIKHIGIKKALSLASCAVFSFAASLYQYSHPYIVIDIIGFTFSLLYICLFIDNPGDKIETSSLLMNNQVYISELGKAFYTNRAIDIIHVNITNYSTIEEMLSYSNNHKFIRVISSDLKDANSDTISGGALFYLKNGKFRVILEDNDLNRTNALAKVLLSTFNRRIKIQDMEISVEASICITQCPQDFNYTDDLLDFYSVAVQFERPGKIVYSKDILLSENYDMQVNIGKLVEHGIVRNSYEVFYQPIYNVKTGEYEEVEAILRLHDEDNRIWEEESFLPVAEKIGSIIELGRFEFEEICKFISSRNFKNTAIKKISMNLTVTQCLQKDLLNQIVSTLEKYQVSPDQIKFEVTESLASDNQSVFAENLKKLAEEGIELALDNYGTGYSNIITLSTLPIDNIKLDKSFAESGKNERLNAIFEKSINMAKKLDRKVVIEGVNSEHFANKCKRLGCDYLQGDFFAKPMTKSRLVEFYSALR